LSAAELWVLCERHQLSSLSVVLHVLLPADDNLNNSSVTEHQQRYRARVHADRSRLGSELATPVVLMPPRDDHTWETASDGTILSSSTPSSFTKTRALLCTISSTMAFKRYRYLLGRVGPFGASPKCRGRRCDKSSIAGP
jgi:hypothetical protein